MLKSKLGKLKKLPKRVSSATNHQANVQGIEKVFADIHRLTSDKQLESVEEANEFMQNQFFRYCMLREQIADSSMRKFVQKVIFDLCDWLCLNEVLVKPDTDRVTGLKKYFINLDDKTVSSVERGWMIACELGKTQHGSWEFVEIDAIYPSLPF